MCIATAALISAGVGALGAGVGVAGQIQAGKAQAASSNYQAQVARNNATIAQQNADYALQAGDVAAGREGQKGAGDMGAIKVAQAASGINVNSGSAVDVQAGAASANAQDQETIRQDALLKAYGYRSQSADFTSQSVLDTAAAKQAKTGSYLSAGAGLLGDASSLGFKWSQYGPNAKSSDGH